MYGTTTILRDRLSAQRAKRAAALTPAIVHRYPADPERVSPVVRMARERRLPMAATTTAMQG